MQSNHGPQPLLRITDSTGDLNHALLGDIHGLVHQVEQNLVLALKVVIEAALTEFQRGGNVIHRCAVVSLLLKQAGSSPQYVLPRISSGVAGHWRTGYTVEAIMPNRDREQGSYVATL